LANVSFTKETHEMLLLNDCIEIFELLPGGRMEKEPNKYSYISLLNLSLNPKSFKYLEKQINMINSLSLIDEVNKITQVKILFSAFTYLIQDCKDIVHKKKIPSEFHH
jgi:hypothetical protein